jgi:regulator of sirC expression with transglutaminase-like and TPR domain
MIPKTRDDAAIALKVCASAHSERFDLTACAIACAIHENPDRDTHGALEALAEITSLAKKKLPRSAEAFAQLLFADLGYTGCVSDYDAPEQADFVEILANRTGIPVGLGHVWRHAARAIDAPLFGTDTPGHFIMRLETNQKPVFIDPLEVGAILDDVGLNEIARQAGLETLMPRMLSPVSDRIMAVRLQTNLVARARARGDGEAWYRAAFRRATLAPKNYQVALDFSEAAQAAGYMKTALEWAQIAAQLPGAPSGGAASSIQQRAQTLNQTLN